MIAIDCDIAIVRIADYEYQIDCEIAILVYCDENRREWRREMLNVEKGPNGDAIGGLSAKEKDTVTIIVNGRPKAVPKNASLSFWDVVRLAFDNPQTGDGIQYTVQYTRGEDHKPSGSLVEGQSVKVKEGMEFDVTPTNRS